MELTQPPEPRTIARLRVETKALRRGLERQLGQLGDAASWLDYRLYLFRMFGFLAPIERALSALPALESVVADAGLRNNKVALLAHDLVSLGVERRDLAHLPRMAVPGFRELPEALGWMYVLEAATLEGRDLARRLAARLPGEIECASAFLGCYGDEANARWRAFGAALDEYATRAGGGEGERIIDAATDCYVRLHRWLRIASAPSPVARVSA